MKPSNVPPGASTIKSSLLVAIVSGLAAAATAQAPARSPDDHKKNQSMPLSAREANDLKAAASSSKTARASKLIGMKVRGVQGKDVGRIKDLVVNVTTGEVRYAMLEFDAGFLQSERVFAVPLSELDLEGDRKALRYTAASGAKMEKAGIEKPDWEKAVDNSRYLSGLDETYGFKPPTGTDQSFRASELIGKKVNVTAGNDIGRMKDLVVDLAEGKVSVAVLAFDPSWAAREKLFAFPLSSFRLTKNRG